MYNISISFECYINLILFFCVLNNYNDTNAVDWAESHLFQCDFISQKPFLVVYSFRLFNFCLTT